MVTVTNILLDIGFGGLKNATDNRTFSVFTCCSNSWRHSCDQLCLVLYLLAQEGHGLGVITEGLAVLIQTTGEQNACGGVVWNRMIPSRLS